MPALRVFLASGFTPLHLGSFLLAHCRRLFPGRNVTLETGLYGDLPGNLRRGIEVRADAIAVTIEWSDIDPRLGVRQLGGWTPESVSAICANVRKTVPRLEQTLGEATTAATLVISPPTLPLPPFSHEPIWQLGAVESSIRSTVNQLLERLAGSPAIRIISPEAVDSVSVLTDRFDITSEINTGFPYTMKHADRCGDLLARAICNASPKKGLITDLDDTLWRGILGEVGSQGVCWDLSGKAHIHGLYQQFLAALASRGVLVGVASKNDPGLVAETLRNRGDLLVGTSQLFPVDSSWNPKSEAVGRILKAWNVAADSVVFVDDSALELEEVRCSYPEIEAFQFTPNDPKAVWSLINQLQALFGKSEIRQEDRLRANSLRSAVEFSSAGDEGTDQDVFLSQLEAVISVSLTVDPGDGRPLELINKTNQFNLNGGRILEPDWRAHLADPNGLAVVVTYQDKFGPLGKIAVIAGHKTGRTINIRSWVMSCRAFARRIEYQCLKLLFELGEADEISLDYQETARNGPVRDFLTQMRGTELTSPVLIKRADFENSCPALFHTVTRIAW